MGMNHGCGNYGMNMLPGGVGNLGMEGHCFGGVGGMHPQNSLPQNKMWRHK